MKFLKPTLAFFVLFSMNISLAQNFDDVTITTIKLSNSLYMLTGAGGNIGVLIGDDGVLVIDDQYAPLTSKINDAIKALSKQPIRFLINTHHHGDHTGGNINMEKLGAQIIAHKNVRTRLEQSNAVEGEAKTKGLPILTFNDSLNLHFNNETVMAFHASNAHTNGDVLLYFTNNNALHTGDTYFNGRYPYIDLNSGGSVNGYINSAKQALMLMDESTQIIPGHGGLSNKKEFDYFISMLETIKLGVESEIANGATEDDVANNTSITSAYDALGYGDGFISRERILRIFYNSLSKS